MKFRSYKNCRTYLGNNLVGGTVEALCRVYYRSSYSPVVFFFAGVFFWLLISFVAAAWWHNSRASRRPTTPHDEDILDTHRRHASVAVAFVVAAAIGVGVSLSLGSWSVDLRAVIFRALPANCAACYCCSCRTFVVCFFRCSCSCSCCWPQASCAVPSMASW